MLNIAKKIRNYTCESNKEKFDLSYAVQEKNPWIALTLSIFLGIFGIDRFYINHWEGSVKLFCLIILIFYQKNPMIGWFGFIFPFLYIADWFLIMSATRKYNIEIAKSIAIANGASVERVNGVVVG